MKIDIEKIQKLDLKEDEFLFVKLPDNSTNAVMTSVRDSLRKMLGPERKHRVMVYAGDVELAVIKMKEYADNILLGLEDQ